VALLVVGAVAALTAGAYSAGFVAGAGSSATNVSPWVSGGTFGVSGIVGLIVTVLILVIIFRVMSLIFWRHGRHGWDRWSEGREGPAGPGGPGPWYPGWRHGRWQESRQAAFEEWHRHAHEAATSQPSGGPGGPAAG
jgi:uncharacterized membrane protein